jgi:hypothetical protein
MISGSVRGALAGVLRNWPMWAVAIVAALLALSSTSRGDWIRSVAIGLVAVGVVLNLIAMCANGGRMPVQTDEIPSPTDSEHQIMGSNTRLWFLGDWIRVRDWLISPGDVCLYAGLAIALVARLVGLFMADA